MFAVCLGISDFAWASSSGCGGSNALRVSLLRPAPCAPPRLRLRGPAVVQWRTHPGGLGRRRQASAPCRVWPFEDRSALRGPPRRTNSGRVVVDDPRRPGNSAGEGAGYVLAKDEASKEVLPAYEPTLGWRTLSKAQMDGERSKLRGVLHPNDVKYRSWWAFTIFAAAFTGIFTPWQIAFYTPEQLFSLDNAAAWIEAALLAVFSADLLLNFFVAFHDEERLVHDRRQIADGYIRSGRFMWDVLGTIPLDGLVLAAMATTGNVLDARDQSIVALLRLLHLVRIYRVKWLFTYLEYNLTVSLLTTTVLRNAAIMIYLTHWSACAFFDVAQLVGFEQDMLIGADAGFFSGLALPQQYLYSIYWALSTLTADGYPDAAPSNISETVSATIRTLLFMAFNIALGAYVVGTTTLLVVKSDERTGRYRESAQNLRDYTSAHDLPEDLRESMQEHLRLHFENEEASDETVLAVYPTTIRRRILRHLYLQHLQSTYLFAGCGQKFLDALLAASRLELYLPKVDILAAGEMVTELCIMVGGVVEVVPQGGGRGSSDSEDLLLDPDTLYTMDMSASAAQYLLADNAPRLVQQGELFGEAAYFTETPQLEAIRSLTVTRVMIISRAAFESVERQFPIASRRVLENLKKKAEEAVASEFGKLEPAVYNALVADLPARLRYSWASAELLDSPSRATKVVLAQATASMDAGEGKALTPRQEQVLANLVRVQALVSDHISKLDEEATTQFLYAASRGSRTKVRQMLNQGFEVDRPDYDGRTALMLASVKGHKAVVRILLDAGADPNQRDALGSSALMEACKHGHDRVAEVLRDRGARLGNGSVQDASLLCTCVYEGDLPKLRRLLLAGVPVDASDYDGRTALHVSAAEGNLAAMKLLVEEGKARLDVLDRWGHTPLDEAERIGASNVVKYLVSKVSHDEDYFLQHEQTAQQQQQGNSNSSTSLTDDDDEEPWWDRPRGHGVWMQHKTDRDSFNCRHPAGLRRGSSISSSRGPPNSLPGDGQREAA